MTEKQLKAMSDLKGKLETIRGLLVNVEKQFKELNGSLVMEQNKGKTHEQIARDLSFPASS